LRFATSTQASPCADLLDAHLLGGPENAEDLEQHRHDDGAAADPEQAGEDAGGDTRNHHGCGEPHQLAERHPQQHFLPR